MKRAAIVLAGLVLAVILAYWLFAAKAEREIAAQVIPCDELTQGCSLPGIKVQALQTPSAMKAFAVEVATADAATITARFEMRDMSMGWNQYRFLDQGAGRWLANVTLPVCVDGRSDWLMLLDVTSKAGKLQRYQVAFAAPAEQSGAGHAHHHAH